MVSYNFNITEFENGVWINPTRMPMPKELRKTLDRDIEAMSVDLSEVKLIKSIDEYPEPRFLKFDVKKFIPKSVIDIVRKEEKEIIESIEHWFSVDFDSIKKIFEVAHPADGKEFAEWMHEAAAIEVKNRFVAENYNQSNNSYVATASGDPYVPGVSLDEFAFEHRIGYSVFDRGYARLFIRGYDDETIPNQSGRTIIKSKLLGFAKLNARRSVQYNGSIWKWRTLANVLTSPKIRNIVCDKHFGRVINPQFIAQVPRRAVKFFRARLRFFSKVDQKIKIRWRNPNNYTDVAYEDFIEADAGMSEMTYTIGSATNVPPAAIEIQPEKDQFAIQEYEVVEVG